jgi:hypothetical protein
MKKLLCILAAVMLLLPCAGAFALSESAAAIQARQALLSHWKELYQTDSYQGHAGYLEIKNTRVFTIRDTVSSGSGEGSSKEVREANDKKAREAFGDVACIVEFLLLSDYYMTEPYYAFVGAYDHVIVRKDGSVSVSAGSPFQRYRAVTYSNDFSGIIEKTDDLKDALNGVFTLRK